MTVSSFLMSTACTLVTPRSSNCRTDGAGQRLEGARDGDLAVLDVLDEHLGGEQFVFQVVAERKFFDGVEQLDQVLVRAVADGAQERRRQKLPAALAAVQDKCRADRWCRTALPATNRGRG